MMTRWVLIAVLLGACEKPREAPPPDEHPPMAATEEERGQKLCQAYADRICRCADKDPKDLSLRDACDLAKAEPSAVRMHLDVLHGAPLAPVDSSGQVAKEGEPAGKRPPLNENERRLTEASLRKVIAACVELDAQLSPAKCPR
jgi:hypothetical protein